MIQMLKFYWTDFLLISRSGQVLAHFHLNGQFKSEICWCDHLVFPHTIYYFKKMNKFLPPPTGFVVSSDFHDANPTPTFPAWLLAVHWLWSHRDKAVRCTVPPLPKQRLKDKRAALQYAADHHLLSSASHLLFHGCKVSTSKMLIWREEKHPVSLANFLST